MDILETIPFCLSVSSKFDLIFKDAYENIGCNYINYQLENLHTKKHCLFQSNKEWNYLYLNEGYINECHILKRGRDALEKGKKNLILPLDFIMPKNKNERRVSEIRLRFGIGSGISFSKEFLYFREHVTFCGAFKDVNYTYYLIENLTTVKSYIESLRTLGVADLILENERITFDMIKNDYLSEFNLLKNFLEK